jgi:SAM-dependent methyltransferase
LARGAGRESAAAVTLSGFVKINGIRSFDRVKARPTMRLLNRIMENTAVYSLWQAPFAEKKFAPILAHNDLLQVRRALDVGCGPGTNAPHFAHTRYLGIDHNLRYLQHARRRFGRDFLVADIRHPSLAPSARFDFILVNSFLHHIDEPATHGILGQVDELLAEDGHVHILELVLPAKPSAARLLARLDRGEFPRPLEIWRKIFEERFEPVVFEAYPVTGFSATLWEMIYFKGRRKLGRRASTEDSAGKDRRQRGVNS